MASPCTCTYPGRPNTDGACTYHVQCDLCSALVRPRDNVMEYMDAMLHAESHENQPAET